MATAQPRPRWSPQTVKMALSLAERAREMGGAPGYKLDGVVTGAMQERLYRALLAHKESSVVALRIDSPGGDLHVGMDIYSTLRRWPGVVIALIARADSAASVIAAGADVVLAYSDAQMSIHRPHIDARLRGVSAASLRRMAGEIDTGAHLLTGVYAERSGLSPEFWEAALRRNFKLTAEDAHAAGLVDVVLRSKSGGKAS